MKTKFYPTITAISGNQYKKINEAEKLNIKKLCVFFSPLNIEERKKLYKELEKSTIEEIPFAHIRGDFTKDEMYFLKKRFKTKLFNFHSENQYPIKYDFSEFKNQIYIENTTTQFSDYEIKKYAGLCLDVSHLENDRLTKNDRYIYFSDLISKMNCACGHASAIKETSTYYGEVKNERYDKHVYSDLKDFDYLLKYKDILPETIAIEVENTLEEQIEAIKYINNLLKL